MNNQPIYVKFNSYRKPKFNMGTEIIHSENGYTVRKFAPEKEGREFLKQLKTTHDLLVKSKLPLEVNDIKIIDEDTLEIEYIEGITLLNELKAHALKNSKEGCLKVFKSFSKLLDQFPTKNEYLSEDFVKIFGKVNKEKYDVIIPGVLDLNLDNIIKERSGNLTLIDFEWTFEFAIPKRYILYRTMYGSYVALRDALSSVIQIEDMEKEFGFTEDEIRTYLDWEIGFQNYVTGNKSDLEEVINNRKQLWVKTLEKDVKIVKKKEFEALVEEKNSLEIVNHDLNKDIIKIEIEKNKIEIEKNKIEIEKNALVPDALEFREFKQTKIWKGLSMYRKIKKYTKNFFINIYRDGPVITFKRIFERIDNIIKYRKQRKIDQNRYKYWVEKNHLSEYRKYEIKKEIENLKYKPLISIVMPVYNVDVKWIKEAIKSIKGQIYTNWELCIADDASTNTELVKYLKDISKDSRIKIVFREKNGHISEASNSALKLATGEFIALMDNDDIIHPHALTEVVKVLNKKKDTDLIYSDEDKLDMKGERVEPFFKPDWSPDLFLSSNYLCHLTVIRKKLIDEIGGFRKGYEGSQDYDLFLRVTEKTKNIEHIPDILYSWRKIPGSTAAVYDSKSYASKTSLKSLEDAIKRRNLDATVHEGLFPGSFRVRYNIKGNPLVSILIPTKDKYEYIERCISSLLEKTTYNNYEILIIDTGSTEKETLNYYKTLENNPKIKFLHWDKKFNYSAVNNYGVKHSKGEYILLLNNDTEVITPDWIEGMLEHAQREEIGAVGVKLYYPNDLIQHAGVVLGIGGGEGKGVAGHAFKGFTKPIRGFPVQKDVTKNYSAVTAACLMIERKKYLGVNGLDEEFRIAFNDVDFCLKLLKKRYHNIYTPYVELYHHESISVGTPEANTRDIKEFGEEIDMMYERWEELILNDPFYNRNLTLKEENFGININKS